MFRIDRNHVHLTKETIVVQTMSLEPTEPVRSANGARPLAAGFGRQAQAAEATKESAARQSTADAQSEAKIVVKMAHLEAEDIRKAAWNDGYIDGKREWEDAILRLKAEDEERRLAQSAQLARALHEVHALRGTVIGELETELLELALAIAKKVIHTTLDENDQAFAGILQSALIQMKREGKVTVRLSEPDFERYFPDGTASFRLGDEIIKATVQGDPYLQPGDCLMESEGETINCGVDSQLKAVRIAFETGKGQEK